MGLFQNPNNKNPRFVEVYAQTVAGDNRIFVDTVTGVNYFWHHDNSGYGGAAGLTVLLNPDGTPVVTPPELLRPQ